MTVSCLLHNVSDTFFTSPSVVSSAGIPTTYERTLYTFLPENQPDIDEADCHPRRSAEKRTVHYLNIQSSSEFGE